MKKYEKPKLIDFSKTDLAHGACANRESNIENCNPGATVVPGCVDGGIPTIECSNGGTF